MGQLGDIKMKKAIVTLGGKVHQLQFDMFAFAQLEELYGTVDEALKALEAGSIKSILDLIYAGSVGQDPTLDRKTMGKGASFNEYIGIQETLIECIMSGFPTTKPEDVAPTAGVDITKLPTLDADPAMESLEATDALKK